MRAKHAVLPGESQEEFNERLENWMDEFNPQCHRERFLVERIVTESWCLDRAVVVEQAMATRTMNVIVEREEKRQADAVAALRRRFDDGDPSVIGDLRMIPAGARWIRDQFGILESYLKSQSYLMMSQRLRVIHLLGKQMGDLFTQDLEVTQWLAAMIGAATGLTDELAANNFWPLKPEAMTSNEFDSRINTFRKLLVEKPRAKALLQKYIADAIAKLDREITLLDAVAERDRLLALQEARIDKTDGGQRLLRYARQREGSCYAAWNRIDKLQNPPRPRPPRGPGKNGAAGGASHGAGELASGPGEEPSVCQASAAIPQETRQDGATAGTAPIAGGTAPTGQPISDAAPATNGAPIGAAPKLEPQPGALLPPPEPAGEGPGTIPDPEATREDVPGARTSEDVPVVEPSPAELQASAPKSAALEPLLRMIEAPHGPGPTGGTPGPGGRAPSNPAQNAIERILRPPAGGGPTAPSPSPARSPPPGC
jgi:hypothetical protein